MRLLLDTHAFLWWNSEAQKLSPDAYHACVDPGNLLLLSVVSLWEIRIKSQLGKLELNRPLRETVSSQLANGLVILPVLPEHVLALGRLPLHHRDPFDRMLLAQAQVEGAALVSCDTAFAAYQANVHW